jgi:hypothetical protein
VVSSTNIRHRLYLRCNSAYQERAGKYDPWISAHCLKKADRQRCSITLARQSAEKNMNMIQDLIVDEKIKRYIATANNPKQPPFITLLNTFMINLTTEEPTGFACPRALSSQSSLSPR